MKDSSTKKVKRVKKKKSSKKNKKKSKAEDFVNDGAAATKRQSEPVQVSKSQIDNLKDNEKKKKKKADKSKSKGGRFFAQNAYKWQRETQIDHEENCFAEIVIIEQQRCIDKSNEDHVS